MENDKLKVEGEEVRIKAGSSAEARELGAMFEHELNPRAKGANGWLDRKLDGLGEIADTLGRPKFVWLAWSLAVVGSVVAYISWARLTIDPDVAWLFGTVGVVIILGVKFSAGLWAEALNVGNRPQAKFFSHIAMVGLVIDMFAGAAFQAALSVDEQTGAADVDRQVLVLDREIRDLTYDLGLMEKPAETAEVLKFDLDRELGRQATNLAGEPAKLTVGAVIGWETDDYCLPGGNYASYIDRYCPDVIVLHRNLIARGAYEDKQAVRTAKAEQVAVLIAERPKSSSGLALGQQISSAQAPWKRYIPGVLLMLIIQGAMVVAAFTAKRHAKGAVAVQGDSP